MAIDVRKINVILPEGVTKVGEISLKGNEAELQLEGVTVGSKEISVNYDNGEAKKTTLVVTEETIFNTLSLEPGDQVFAGGDVKLVASFSRVPVLGEVAITKPVGFTEKTPAAVKGNTVEAVYAAGEVVTDKAEFVVNFREGKAEKKASLAVLERPAVMQSVDVEPKEVRIGVDAKITVVFDKAPKLTDVRFNVPAGLTQKGEATTRGNNVELMVTGKAAGSQVVTVSHLSDENKTVTVTVVADAVVKTAEAAPASVEVGQDAVITVTYDKAFVAGQAAIKVTVGEGLAEKVPYAENPAKNGGTITVTGGTVGSKTVTFELGGQQKVCTIEVTAKPQVQTVSVEPSEIEKGQQAKLKVTL